MTAAENITVISRAYDLSVRRTWHAGLVKQQDSLIELVGEFDRDVEHPNLGLIKQGTVSYEYYWLDRWYNIFQFHEPTGELRNHYCNICMPPTFANGVLDYVDLEIDVLIWPDLTYEVLDEIEFDISAERFQFPATLRTNVRNSLDELIRLIKTPTSTDALPKSV